jgi:hypothetical protein
VQPVLIFWGPTTGSLETSHTKVGPVFVGSGPLHEEWLPSLLDSGTGGIDVESVESTLQAA